jgi:hypothetical protein
VSPFRLTFTDERLTSPEVYAAAVEGLRRNAAANARHPQVARCMPHTRKLAVVGGGPLVRHDLEELRAWDGDVWGINFTAGWLNANGVKATLFTVDPVPFVTDAPDAILATVCSPSLFEHFEGRVRGFNLAITDPDCGLYNGAFSSTSAPAVSLKLGYVDVSFFGCEGSFENQDHIDRHEDRPDKLIVRAGGRDYITCPPYLIQCDELRKLFVFDNVYHNRSGGLLSAMIENPDTWEVVGVSASLKQHLESVHGAQGLYEHPYVPAAA